MQSLNKQKIMFKHIMCTSNKETENCNNKSLYLIIKENGRSQHSKLTVVSRILQL